jgi:A/G-specific adenine glycosylase
MLQQTRVPVVIPYYERFLRAFPTVEKLARAREESVLRRWAGLGYYQRARNLHRAAKEIVRRHGGRFPRRLEEALALPGVGGYTARAVLSIAYQQPVAVVDGNVARTLIRLSRLNSSTVNDRNTLQPLADRLVSRTRPGDFNQALMELGSTLCLPRIPRCPECPLESLCRARQAGVEQKLPRRVRKRARPEVELAVLVIHHDARVLVVREPRGYFSGLWHFPYVSGAKPDGMARRLKAGRARHRATLTHETTMRDLKLHVYDASTNCASVPAGPNGQWVHLRKVGRLGVGAATRKIAEHLARDVE